MQPSFWGIKVQQETWLRRLTGDETANVNFYAVRPEATQISWNNAK